MANTAKLTLPKLSEGQSGAEVTVNDALNRLDSLSQISIKDRDLATPPGSPAEGDTYLVATSPTGAWSGHTGELAMYYSGWVFQTLRPGLLVWVEDETVLLIRKASTWGTVTVT